MDDDIDLEIDTMFARTAFTHLLPLKRLGVPVASLTACAPAVGERSMRILETLLEQAGFSINDLAVTRDGMTYRVKPHVARELGFRPMVLDTLLRRVDGRRVWSAVTADQRRGLAVTEAGIVVGLRFTAAAAVLPIQAAPAQATPDRIAPASITPVRIAAE